MASAEGEEEAAPPAYLLAMLPVTVGRAGRTHCCQPVHRQGPISEGQASGPPARSTLALSPPTALSDPAAKENCMMHLLRSLPDPNLITFLFLLEHLKR